MRFKLGFGLRFTCFVWMKKVVISKLGQMFKQLLANYIAPHVQLSLACFLE